MNLVTLVLIIFVNHLGGLAPDLDSASASFWKKFRGGKLIGKLVGPLLGHRRLSHSLIGLGIGVIIFYVISELLKNNITANGDLILYAYLIGHISHLLADAMTKQGIPLLYPLPWTFGIPPIKRLRMKTGKFTENYLVYPSLIAVNSYLAYEYYDKYSQFFTEFIVK